MWNTKTRFDHDGSGPNYHHITLLWLRMSMTYNIVFTIHTTNHGAKFNGITSKVPVIRSSDNDSSDFWPPGSLHTLGADWHI